ncbi:MAG: AraC family transcriptional regulator [Roseivirga sp.]|nr:AraC family transcriptional regulator [Roseivirga sp.]
MSLGVQGLFFFSAIGAFNGLITGLFIILFHKKKNLSTYFLGILLTMVSMRIGKSAIYFFTQDISRNFLQIGLTACYLIGPALFFYLKSSLRKTKRLSKPGWTHIGVILIPALVLGPLFPYTEHPELWSKYIWHLINLQLAVYIIIAAFQLIPVFKKWLDDSVKPEKHERWPLIIFIGNLIVCLANVAALFTTYILGSLSFSLVFYASLFLLMIRDRKDTPAPLVSKKYTRTIKREQANQLIEELEVLMDQQALYKQQNLKLADVAAALSISAHQLSQLINSNLGKSFSQLISEYRVAETCRLLKTQPHYTFEAIGYDAGFSSKSTFFTTFKRIKGQTPAQYKQAFIPS